jgi:hypothetical protein
MISREYFNGVQEFVTFASKQATNDGMILCPCVKCVNSTFLDIEVVRLHLESFGICFFGFFWIVWFSGYGLLIPIWE